MVSTMHEKITKQQIVFLTHISKVIRNTGYPPSGRELAKHFKVSRSRANQILRFLRINKLIQWADGDLNTIKLTKAGHQILGVRHGLD